MGVDPMGRWEVDLLGVDFVRVDLMGLTRGYCGYCGISTNDSTLASICYTVIYMVRVWLGLV